MKNDDRYYKEIGTCQASVYKGGFDNMEVI